LSQGDGALSLSQSAVEEGQADLCLSLYTPEMVTRVFGVSFDGVQPEVLHAYVSFLARVNMIPVGQTPLRMFRVVAGVAEPIFMRINRSSVLLADQVLRTAFANPGITALIATGSRYINSVGRLEAVDGTRVQRINTNHARDSQFYLLLQGGLRLRDGTIVGALQYLEYLNTSRLGEMDGVRYLLGGSIQNFRMRNVLIACEHHTKHGSFGHVSTGGRGPQNAAPVLNTLVRGVVERTVARVGQRRERDDGGMEAVEDNEGDSSTITGEESSKKKPRTSIKYERALRLVQESSFSFQWALRINVPSDDRGNVLREPERQVFPAHESNMYIAHYEQRKVADVCFPNFPSPFACAADDFELCKRVMSVYNDPLDVDPGFGNDSGVQVSAHEASLYNDLLNGSTCFLTSYAANSPHCARNLSRGNQHQFLFMSDSSAVPTEIGVLTRAVSMYNVGSWAAYGCSSERVVVGIDPSMPVVPMMRVPREYLKCDKAALTYAWHSPETLPGEASRLISEAQWCNVCSCDATASSDSLDVETVDLHFMWSTVAMHPMTVLLPDKDVPVRYVLWVVTIEGVDGYNTVGALDTPPSQFNNLTGRSSTQQAEDIKRCRLLHAQMQKVIETQAAYAGSQFRSTRNATGWRSFGSHNKYEALSPFKFMTRVEAMVRERHPEMESAIRVGGHLVFSEENRERLLHMDKVAIDAMTRNIQFFTRMYEWLKDADWRSRKGNSNTDHTEYMPIINFAPVPRYVVKSMNADERHRVVYPEWAVRMEDGFEDENPCAETIPTASGEMLEVYTEQYRDAVLKPVECEATKLCHSKVIGCDFLRGSSNGDMDVASVPLGPRVYGCSDCTHLNAAVVAIPWVAKEMDAQSVAITPALKCEMYLSKLAETFIYPDMVQLTSESDIVAEVARNVQLAQMESDVDVTARYSSPGSDNVVGAGLTFTPEGDGCRDAGSFANHMDRTVRRMGAALGNMTRIMSTEKGLIPMFRFNAQVALGCHGFMYGAFEHAMESAMGSSHDDVWRYVSGINPVLDGFRAHRGSFYKIAREQHLSPCNALTIINMFSCYSYLKNPNSGAYPPTMRYPIFIAVEGRGLSRNIPGMGINRFPTFRTGAENSDGGGSSESVPYCFESYKPNGTGADTVIVAAFDACTRMYKDSAFEIPGLCLVGSMATASSTSTSAAVRNMGARMLSTDPSFGAPVTHTEANGANGSEKYIESLTTTLRRDGYTRSQQAFVPTEGRAFGQEGREKVIMPNLVIVASNDGFGGPNNREKMQTLTAAVRFVPSSYTPCKGDPGSATSEVVQLSRSLCLGQNIVDNTEPEAPVYQWDRESANIMTPILCFAQRLALLLLHAEWAGIRQDGLGHMARELHSNHVMHIETVLKDSLVLPDYHRVGFTRVRDGAISCVGTLALYHRLMGDLFDDVQCYRETLGDRFHSAEDMYNAVVHDPRSWRKDDSSVSSRFFGTLARTSLAARVELIPPSMMPLSALNTFAESIDPAIMYASFAFNTHLRTPVVDYHFLQCLFYEFFRFGHTVFWRSHPLCNHPFAKHLRQWFEALTADRNLVQVKVGNATYRLPFVHCSEKNYFYGDRDVPAVALANAFGATRCMAGKTLWSRIHRGSGTDYTPYVADQMYLHVPCYRKRAAFNVLEDPVALQDALSPERDSALYHEGVQRARVLSSSLAVLRESGTESPYGKRMFVAHPSPTAANVQRQMADTHTFRKYTNQWWVTSSDRDGNSKTVLARGMTNSGQHGGGGGYHGGGGNNREGNQAEGGASQIPYEVSVNILEHLYLMSMFFGTPGCEPRSLGQTIHPLVRHNAATNLVIANTCVSPPCGHGFGDGVFTAMHYTNEYGTDNPVNPVIALDFNVHAEYFPRNFVAGGGRDSSVSMGTMLSSYMFEDLIHVSMIVEILRLNSIIDMENYRNVPVQHIHPVYEFTPGIVYPWVTVADEDSTDKHGYLFITVPRKGVEQDEVSAVVVSYALDGDTPETRTVLSARGLRRHMTNNRLLAYPLVRRNALVWCPRRGLGLVVPLKRREYDLKMFNAMETVEGVGASAFFGDVGMDCDYNDAAECDFESELYAGTHYFDHRHAGYHVQWGGAGGHCEVIEFREIHKYLVPVFNRPLYLKVRGDTRSSLLRDTTLDNEQSEGDHVRVYLCNPSTPPSDPPVCIDPARVVYVACPWEIHGRMNYRCAHVDIGSLVYTLPVGEHFHKRVQLRA
jgi:hypothetical protein